MKKIQTTGHGLHFGIPTLGRPVPLEWALALKGLTPPLNYNTTYSIINGQEVGEARNILAKQALELEAKYLFFLGDDTVPPTHALRQLIYRMEQDSEIGVVGGVYCSKSDPPAPLVFVEDGKGSYWDWKVGEFFPVTGLGMDCTLIRTDVFRDIAYPFFKTVDEDKFLDGINSAEAWTEDLYFLKKLREETKWKVFCDASVICDHWDVYSGKKYSLPAGSLPMRQKGVFKDKKCLILGQNIELADESYDITRCNEDSLADYRISFSSLPFDNEAFDWVIVTKPIESYKINEVTEWLRVTKGKVSICLSELLNPDPLSKLLVYNHKIETKLDGCYIELEKKCLT